MMQMLNRFRRKRPDAQQLGRDAKRLLEDPLLAESLEDVEGLVIQLLKTSPMESAEDKERIVLHVLRLQSVAAMQSMLQMRISMGSLAEEQERMKARETLDEQHRVQRRPGFRG